MSRRTLHCRFFIGILLMTTSLFVRLRRIHSLLDDGNSGLQRESPPRKVKPCHSTQTKFVICDCTIELLFKRIKQLLQRHALLSHHALSNQAVFATLLFGWALVEEQAGVLKVALQDDLAFDSCEQEQARHPVSSWQVAAALVHSLRSMILGQWSWQQINQRAGSLRRLFTAHPQDRIHYETTLRRDLVYTFGCRIIKLAFSIVKVPFGLSSHLWGRRLPSPGKPCH
jgi:hypothetical protein